MGMPIWHVFCQALTRNSLGSGWNALLCVMEAKSFSQRMMQRCYDYLKAPMTITY